MIQTQSDDGGEGLGDSVWKRGIMRFLGSCRYTVETEEVKST